MFDMKIASWTFYEWLTEATWNRMRVYLDWKSDQNVWSKIEQNFVISPK